MFYGGGSGDVGLCSGDICDGFVKHQYVGTSMWFGLCNAF